MKVLIFYQPHSENSRSVDEFMHEFTRRYPHSEIQLVDADSVDGVDKCTVYEVMKFPTVIATSSDGVQLQRWDSGMMPLMNEVSYFANQ